jgi:pimeloyl-ACP methyl ester carboxylesterase
MNHFLNMERYVNVRGLKTYVETLGSGEPVLLLHGGTLTKETLSNQADELSKNYGVILPERRGHGRTSDRDEDITYENMADDTIALMENLGIQRAVLCGHSDGANIAMMIAIKRPELVKSIVPISGNFNTDYTTEEERTVIRSWTADDLRKFFPEWSELYYRVVPNASEKYPKLAKKILKLWASDWRIPVQDLARINCPTLVMSADRDIIPLSHTLKMFQNIKDAKLCIVPGTTHALIEEKPQMVNAAIIDFLNSNRS